MQNLIVKWQWKEYKDSWRLIANYPAVLGIIKKKGSWYIWEARTLLVSREAVSAAPPNGTSVSLQQAKQAVEKILTDSGTFKANCLHSK